MNIQNYINQFDKLEEDILEIPDNDTKVKKCEQLRDTYNNILGNTREKLIFGDKHFSNYNTFLKDISFNENVLSINIYSCFYNLSQIKELQVNDKFQEINISIYFNYSPEIIEIKDSSVLIIYISNNQFYLKSVDSDSNIFNSIYNYENIELKLLGSVHNGEIPHLNNKNLI